MTDHAPEPPRVIIFDIDGTLTNAEHRLHHLEKPRKDWESFFGGVGDDDPHDEIVYLSKMLAADAQNVLLVVTGRPERTRDDTEAWLQRHGIEVANSYYRDDGDRRTDSVVKKEILVEIRRAYGEPYLVFEDRSRVVDMWRQEGIRCLQVAPGEF